MELSSSSLELQLDGRLSSSTRRLAAIVGPWMGLPPGGLVGPAPPDDIVGRRRNSLKMEKAGEMELKLKLKIRMGEIESMVVDLIFFVSG